MQIFFDIVAGSWRRRLANLKSGPPVWREERNRSQKKFKLSFGWCDLYSWGWEKWRNHGQCPRYPLSAFTKVATQITSILASGFIKSDWISSIAKVLPTFRQYYTLVEQKAILLIFISIVDKNINFRSKWNWRKGQFELIKISIDSSIYSRICLYLDIEKNINWSQSQSK